ncbi:MULTISPECIES: DUF2905 domain-containing protein [Paenibacillus]|uniref:DUF2905 domain-containing protein n=1 Tax=Paenibacillus campinasensis TaxID=66347 RepID=A0A268F4C8_9BACL|nr:MULTISPECIES: DUF2905 domain-containing protein [Paenibacillus]PAD80225.1 hypothetical protein CHH67_00495 [Paenibacillus campinasensis]PAK55208.1 hypothetical protein CHH75_02815 [Paenibacillus sp. 7541]
MHPVTRVLLIIGGALIVIGLLWPLIGRWVGRLPGDIVVDRPNVKIYFPIVTCLVISVVGSLLLYLIQMFRK